MLLLPLAPSRTVTDPPAYPDQLCGYYNSDMALESEESAPVQILNVRPSNTEPLLRLNVEGDSRETMERNRDAALALIRG